MGKSKIQQKPVPAPQKKPENQPKLVPASRTLTFSIHSPEPKSRKSKNQQNRTMCHLTAEDLLEDPWSWRKYGQKPIRNSPYLRNYYKCSSSKGCLARKQVERSNLDPNIFIVTYTGAADHTHPKPTHRNSLSGSTRNKLSTAKPSSGKKCTVAVAAEKSSAEANNFRLPDLDEGNDDELINDGFTWVPVGSCQ